MFESKLTEKGSEKLHTGHGKWAKGSEAQRNAPGGSRATSAGGRAGVTKDLDAGTPWWKKKLEKAKGQAPVVNRRN